MRARATQTTFNQIGLLQTQPPEDAFASASRSAIPVAASTTSLSTM